MSYFKSLGLDTSRFRVSSVRQVSAEQGTPVTATTDEMAAAKAEEAAFLASLPRCSKRNVRTGEVVLGYLYTNRDGTKICTTNPVGTRAHDLLGTVTVTETMPLYNPNNTLRRGYIDKLLEAQGRPGVQVEAQRLGIDWYAGYMGKPSMGVAPISPGEMLGARLIIQNDLTKGGYTPKAIADVRGTAVEAGLKLFLAISAARIAMLDLPKQRKDRVEGKGVSTHFPSDCLKLGLPDIYLPCCAQAITRGGFGIESYAKAIENQDPAVMACFHAAQSAADAKSRMRLLMAAGAVGALVVGASLLKKGKKR